MNGRRLGKHEAGKRLRAMLPPAPGRGKGRAQPLSAHSDISIPLRRYSAVNDNQRQRFNSNVACHVAAQHTAVPPSSIFVHAWTISESQERQSFYTPQRR